MDRRYRDGLSLRELEAFARAGLTRLLAFLHPRIAAEKTFGFQSSPKIRINEEKRARDRETGRARLAGCAATSRVDGEIVRVR